MLKKILIANRGEIAVRIARACHEMDIEAVAIFSDPDRTSLHVQLADEAYGVGPAPSIDSYLNQDKILDIAKQCGADAIHPGYGFLAENGQFADRVEQAGLNFIGPTAAAIDLMGDKTRARVLAQDNGIPTVPGTLEPISSGSEAAKIARDIGFPVLLKAAAGGGGKGMRKVRKKSELTDAFRASQNEARSAFGDDRIYLEKYVQGPRHIEFQILGDTHGNMVHLFERECSIQRRHQKLLEESPSVLMTPELRQKMGEAAVGLAQASQYTNAGTIEFLVDSHGDFFFLEMNTRLQVEHPVTEAVTGLDLVREQIKIASGQPLAFGQEDVRLSGHAIECRIYAEDPASGFMPSTGKVEVLFEPNGNGVRCDSGIVAGSTVYPYYDPLLAKLVVWAENRDAAIARMRRALIEYQLHGVENTLSFFIPLMDHEVFKRGTMTTHFIDEEGSLGQAATDGQLGLVAAVSSVLHHAAERPGAIAIGQPDGKHRSSHWKMAGRKENLNK